MIFDTYIVVDWSANKTPKLGQDSIWLDFLRRDARGRMGHRTQNIATRWEARAIIQAYLRRQVAADRRTIVGFDLCFGFPEGTARKLGLRGKPWQAMWDLIDHKLEDDQQNENNRFEVAAAFNETMSGQAVPFWGCPASVEQKFLKQKRAPRPKAWPLKEFRLIDERLKAAHSPWKLYTSGSVGGQTLTGIPVVKALLDEPSLKAHSLVWPFETGFLSPSALTVPWRIIHAEMYLSLLPVDVPENGIKDEAQVRTHARYLADLDQAGDLGKLFEGPRGLSKSDTKMLLEEEGWTLGVT